MQNADSNINGSTPIPSAAAIKPKIKPATVVKRILLSVGTFLLLTIIAVFAMLSTIASGPSETLRDALVLSAMQASATKWVPGLFLDDALVDQIVKNSQASNMQSIDINSVTQHYVYETTAEGEVVVVPGGSTEQGEASSGEDWSKAIDGMLYFSMKGSTYKAYILLVRDPSRVYVGTSSDYKSNQTGIRIFDIVKREGAVAAINGGEFFDDGGGGTGNNPIGLTFALGKCVWNDGARRTFMGFDRNHQLVVSENMTKARAEALGIRDAVSFKTGNVLVSREGDTVNLHYSDSNTGLAQRTAIGQRADGTVILCVTDGRTSSSVGANHNDIVNLMASLGAVNAGMLDGGSSTLMYYEDYYTKYNMDTEYFDTYQLQGLVNKYKAFTKPRRIPTYFLVAPLTEQEGANQ